MKKIIIGIIVLCVLVFSTNIYAIDVSNNIAGYNGFVFNNPQSIFPEVNASQVKEVLFKPLMIVFSLAKSIGILIALNLLSCIALKIIYNNSNMLTTRKDKRNLSKIFKSIDYEKLEGLTEEKKLSKINI